MKKQYRVLYGDPLNAKTHRRCSTVRGAYNSMERLAVKFFHNPCFVNYPQGIALGTNHVIGYWQEWWYSPLVSTPDGNRKYPLSSCAMGACVWCQLEDGLAKP